MVSYVKSKKFKIYRFQKYNCYFVFPILKCANCFSTGSPFQYTVGPLKDFGSHLVKAGGNGLEFGEVGDPSPFNVWTREAGSGSLAMSVEGPSKALIDFVDRKDGSCDISYTVTEPGEID